MVRNNCVDENGLLVAKDDEEETRSSFWDRIGVRGGRRARGEMTRRCNVLPAISDVRQAKDLNSTSVITTWPLTWARLSMSATPDCIGQR